MRGTRPAGYGFVSVKDKKVADDAIAALNNKELKGRPVVVEHAKDEETKKKEASERKARRTSRRGSRAPRGEVTEEEANGEAAAPAEGQADAPKRTKKKRNAAVRNPTSHFFLSCRRLIDYRLLQKKIKDKVAEAVGAEGAATTTEGEGGEKLKKKRAPKPRRPAGEDPVGMPSKTSVFVANLPFSFKDSDLSALFTEKDITVVEARVVLTRWGRRRSKGYAFVNVGTEEEQQKAISALHGYEIDDGKGTKRAIAVKVAVDGQTEKDEDKENAEPAAAAAEEVSAAA